MIASYLRESTDQQDIETQRLRIQEHCAKNNIVSQEFADDAVSGTIPFSERPQSSRLLAEARQGRIQELIVYRFDRLGRDHADTYMAIGELLRLGVAVNSLKEGRAENTASGRLKTGIHTLFAQYERDSIVERSVDASQRLAKGGMWMGGVAPYGYRQVGEDKQARLALSEEPISPTCKLSEAAVIRLIFQKAANGESCWEIAKHLNNDLGILPAYADPRRDARRGGKNQSGEAKQRPVTKGIWWSTGIRSIIMNRTYMGEHVWGKQQFVKKDGKKHLKSAPREQWITRQCPAIVSPEVWAQANAMLHRSQTARIGHRNHQYLLRGLIRCCECGRTYIGVTAKQRNGTERAYYRCASKYTDRSIRDTSARCSAPGLRGEALEASVWDYVAGFLARPGLAIRQLKNQMAAETKQGRVADTIKDLETSRARKIEGRKSVLRQLGEGLFPEADVKATVQRIDAAVSDIDARLAQLRIIAEERETRLISLDWAGRLLGDLRAELISGELTFEKKRKFVENLVAGIKIPNDGAPPEVTFRFEPDYQRFQEWRRWGLVPAYTGPDPA